MEGRVLGHAALTRQSGDPGSILSVMRENPLGLGDDVGDHQVIIRDGNVEAVVVPLDEYRSFKALEQRETELYWAVHEARYPAGPGHDEPTGKLYDSMDDLLADLNDDQ
jgi:hypothetical protein